MSEPTDEIWYAKNKDAFFRIPAGTELPDGDFWLMKFGGGSRSVDRGALSLFEISKEEANQIVGDRMNHAWGKLQGAFGQLVGFGKDAAKATGVDVSDDAIGGIPDLKSILGVQPGDLITDPEGARTSIGDAVHRIKEATQGSGLNTEEAQGKMDALNERLKEMQLEEKAEKAGAQIREALARPEFGDAIQSIGSALQDMGARLREHVPPAAPSEADTGSEAKQDEPAESTSEADMKLIQVGFFREFPHGDAAGPSIHDAIGEGPMEDADKLAAYLDAGELLVFKPGLADDVLSDGIAGTMNTLTDGRFAWTEDLSHYVRKHNLSLPDAFVAHIRANGFAVPQNIDVSTLELD